MIYKKYDTINITITFTLPTPPLQYNFTLNYLAQTITPTPSILNFREFSIKLSGIGSYLQLYNVNFTNTLEGGSSFCFPCSGSGCMECAQGNTILVQKCLLKTFEFLFNQGAGKRPRQCCHKRKKKKKSTVTRGPEGPESGRNMRVRGPEGPEDELR